MTPLRPDADASTAISQLEGWLAAADPVELVIETSGSTGAPKRVLLSRAAVLASVHASAERLGAHGQWLLSLPASYVAGVQVIARSLVAGHRPVQVHESYAAALAEAEAEHVFTSLVPTQLHRLLSDPAETAALARLHTVLVGGGAIDPALRRRATAAGITVVATYGASETAGGCVYDRMPLEGVAVALDTDGRIRLGGPTLFSGYLGDPELTAHTLVNGWYLTSDAGRIDEDGRLQVLGRVDDVVVSGGLNVPLPAVATRLREHPEIEWVEVLGVPDPEWGDRVVAFVVGTLELEAARDWVQDAHPRSWAPRQLVTLESMPLLDNGKVDRVALRRLAEH